jgi:hypothetical protein
VGKRQRSERERGESCGGERRGGGGGAVEEVLEHVACGCAAGSISKWCTLPLDVTKKRLQVSLCPSLHPSIPPSHSVAHE